MTSGMMRLNAHCKQRDAMVEPRGVNLHKGMLSITEMTRNGPLSYHSFATGLSHCFLVVRSHETKKLILLLVTKCDQTGFEPAKIMTLSRPYSYGSAQIVQAAHRM